MQPQGRDAGILGGQGLALAGPGGQRYVIRSGRPGLLALRSALGAASTVGFFYALRELPFAEIFLFIALMPILAALLSSIVFGDTVPPAVWGALALGLGGMGAMLPEAVPDRSGAMWWVLPRPPPDRPRSCC